MVKDKINILELLKNCPKGMELDCTLFDNVVFDGIDFSLSNHPIILRRLKTNVRNFVTKYGQFYGDEDGKCIIFPKGKTTWEGFVPPCKFKDGDIVYCSFGGIAILKITTNLYYSSYCGLFINKGFKTTDVIVSPVRFANEKEKKILFDAIKANGYKWNQETKTLEKPVEPIFKVGNIIKNKYTCEIATIEKICESTYMASLNGTNIYIDITLEEHWELVGPNKFDITTLKPFESRVLVRNYNDEMWMVSFWGRLINCEPSFRIECDTVRGCYKQCIPYEGNEHLLGTNNDCSEYYKFWQQ